MGLDFGIEWTIESLFAAEPKTSDADGNAVKHNNWWNTNMLKKMFYFHIPGRTYNNLVIAGVFVNMFYWDCCPYKRSLTALPTLSHKSGFWIIIHGWVLIQAEKRWFGFFWAEVNLGPKTFILIVFCVQIKSEKCFVLDQIGSNKKEQPERVFSSGN